jgi:hypothetical protein
MWMLMKVKSFLLFKQGGNYEIPKIIITYILYCFNFFINPAYSQYNPSFTFENYYENLKTRGFQIIMIECGLGKEKNNKGQSYWDESNRKLRRKVWEKAHEEVKNVGGNDYNIISFISAVSKLMNETCPNVW